MSDDTIEKEQGILGSPCGKGYHLVRFREGPDGEPVPVLGHITPVQEGEAITNGEIVRIHHEGGPHCQVETLARVGPSTGRAWKGNLRAYSEGWDRIFGKNDDTSEVN